MHSSALFILFVLSLAGVSHGGKADRLSKVDCKERRGLGLMPLHELFEGNKRYKIPEVDAEDLDARTFYGSYVSRSIPVVINNGLKKWPASSKWQRPGYLESKIGDAEVTVETSKGKEFLFYGKTFKSKEMPYREFSKLYNSPERKENLYIAQNDLMGDALKPLLSDVRRPSFTSFLKQDELLFGQGAGGQVTPIHYDDAENVLSLFAGTKTFTLFDPSQSNYLYPVEKSRDGGLTSEVNITNPDHGAFPLFKKARSIKVTLRAGQMLYVPSYWWHEVESSMEPQIAVNFWFMCHSRLVHNMMSVFEDRVVCRTKELRKKGKGKKNGSKGRGKNSRNKGNGKGKVEYHDDL